MSEILLTNCPFCTNEARLFHDGTATFVQCQTCRAKGPGQEGVDYDAMLKAAEKWNKRGGFGNARVSIANDQLPVETYKLIERIREVAETLERGQLGEPQAAVLLLLDRNRKQLHIRELRLQHLEVNDVVAAAVQALQIKHRVKDAVK